MSKAKRLLPSISCHAFNKDGSLVAVSPNNNEVHVYKTNGKPDDYASWTLSQKLNEHHNYVSGIDWHPETNKIVTCGHDRNAYVWEFKQDEHKTEKWMPTLVILRINRAATSVKWSPKGDKFAVTSGAKVVPICHFEQENNWWVAKQIKKFKSTVLCVSWCPNNKFVVCGSADNKMRVFSAYIKDVDGDTNDDGYGQLWPNQFKFGDILWELDAKQWVNSVAWSPNGFRIAAAGHGSTMVFVQLSGDGQPDVQTLRHRELPFLSVAFLDDDTVVSAGWDCNPAVWKASGDAAKPTWDFFAVADKAEKKEVKASSSTFSNARNMWADKTKRGLESGSENDTVLNTKHQNTITCIFVNGGGKFSTSSIDGQILPWDLANVKA